MSNRSAESTAKEGAGQGARRAVGWLSSAGPAPTAGPGNRGVLGHEQLEGSRAQEWFSPSWGPAGPESGLCGHAKRELQLPTFASPFRPLKFSRSRKSALLCNDLISETIAEVRVSGILCAKTRSIRWGCDNTAVAGRALGSLSSV